MATINASTSGVGGVITTADATGVLDLQTADVTRASVSSSGLKISRVDSSNEGGQLDLCRSTDNTSAWAIDVYGNTSTPSLRFVDNVAAAARMVVDGSGNVLVGTTSTLATNQHNFQSSSTTSAAVMTLRNAGATAGLFWQVGPDSNSSFKVYNASNTGMFMSNGSTSWSSSSDETLKTDLKPIENGINKVNSLRSVTGRFKTDEETVSRSFLIAQDVQAVLPEAVSETPDGYLGVAYTDVIPLLVASIKELKAIVDTQAERIAVLESK